MVLKGASRDTAWFSLLDSEWPMARQALQQWLHEGNFDANGMQNCRLEEFQNSIGCESKLRVEAPDYDSIPLPMPEWRQQTWPITPQRLEGRYVRLERLDAAVHTDG